MEKEYEVINQYTFQIDGSMRIEEVNEAMDLNLPESEDYETIAGFVLNLLGYIPKEGEQLGYEGLKVTVTKMRGAKIEEILLNKQRRKVQKGKSADRKSEEKETPISNSGQDKSKPNARETKG